MHHYVVNRACRGDRLALWRGAMAAQGVEPHEMHRVVARDRDDYPDAQALCESARPGDFGAYFQRHLESPMSHIGLGHLLCSWSVLGVWQDIANGRERACQWLDDYALRVPSSVVLQLAEEIGADVLLLAWHFRHEFFRENYYRLPVTWNPPEQVSIHPRRREVFVGTLGTSDWALVLSPTGAVWLLDYMLSEPHVYTEVAPGAMFFANPQRATIFSVRANNPRISGLETLRGNRWVVDLSPFCEGASSDLVGLHEEG